MAEIYLKNKKEFIHDITTNEIYFGSLDFEKKLPDYQLFLPFIPKVLIDIIIQYMSSNITIQSCEYYFRYYSAGPVIDIHTSYLVDGVIKYESKTLDFVKENNCLMLYKYSSDIISYNTFMKKYYNKEQYLPNVQYGYMYKYLNPKLVKYTCIILRKIMKIMHSLTINGDFQRKNISFHPPY